MFDKVTESRLAGPVSRTWESILGPEPHTDVVNTILTIMILVIFNVLLFIESHF